MRIERTTVNQSAAGALLAALAKGERPDAGNFQQTFSDSIGAVSRRDAERRDDGIKDDLNQKRQPLERQERAPRQRTEEATTDADNQRKEPVQREAARPESDSSAQQPAAAKTSDSQPAAAENQPQQEAAAAPVQAAAQATETSQSAGNAQLNTVEAAAAAMAAAAQAQQARRLGVVAAGEVQAAADSDTQAVTVVTPAAEQAMNQTSQGRQDAMAVAAQATNPVEQAEQAPVVDAGPRQDVAEAVGKKPQVRPSMLEGRKVTVADHSSAAQQDQAAGRTRSDDTFQLKPQQAAPQQSESRQALHSLNLQAMGMRADIINMQVVAPIAADAAAGGETAEGGRPMQINSTTRTQDVRMAMPDTAEEAPRAEQNEQIERITRVIRASLSRGGSRINLQLEPEELGKLRINMQLRSGELTARFETQNEASRSWLQNGLNQLRESLASHGIRLVEATVNTNGADSDSAFLNFGSGEQQTFDQAQGDNRQDRQQAAFGNTGGAGAELEESQSAPAIAASPEPEALNIIG